jgi:hypothetical protein
VDVTAMTENSIGQNGRHGRHGVEGHRAADDIDGIDGIARALRASTDWRTVPEDQGEQLWAGLQDWVDWLVARYQVDYRVIPPCWHLHSALVDVLTALWDFHTYAFEPASGPTSAVEWHRAFRDLEERLREWAARTGCTSEAHWPDTQIGPTARVPDRDNDET